MPEPLEQQDPELGAMLEKYIKSIKPGLSENWNVAIGSHGIEKNGTLIWNPKKDLPGRNEPCFCGSGKKFKKCCIR